MERTLIARNQLSAAGITRARVRWCLRSGRWQAVLPGIYATFTGELPERQRLAAALLYGGDTARLTGPAALTVHGFQAVPPSPCVDVVVPRTRRVRSAGFVRIHRTGRDDPFARTTDGLRVSSPERAVVEAARACPDPRRVRALVAEAVQRDRCTVGDLIRELHAAPRAGTASLRVAIGELLDGVRSVAEGDARRLLAGSRVLPELLWNPLLIGPDGVPLPSPDGWLADVDVGLEVDSRAYHLSPADWERTMRRHVRLTEVGALILHFSPGQIRREPESFVASVERAYLSRLQGGYSSHIHATQHP